jgi:hypothetical protein
MLNAIGHNFSIIVFFGSFHCRTGFIMGPYTYSFIGHVWKPAIYLGCTAIFFYLMVDIWTKFGSSATTMAIQHRRYSARPLPCITVHHVPGFKTQGLYKMCHHKTSHQFALGYMCFLY